MAAGDIIIPDNTITPEIIQQIAAAVEDLIASTAKDPGQYEEVSSLTGVSSFPPFKYWVVHTSLYGWLCLS